MSDTLEPGALAARPVSRRLASCRSVIMVGTHQTTMGGISTVVRGYERGGLFSAVDCEYITTHRDGNGLVKLRTAIGAVTHLVGALLRGRAPLVHIHISSRASFWRKAVICLIAMGARRPYVLHMHGSEFMQFYREECGPLAQRVVRLIFSRAALVLALSERWREDLLSIAPGADVEVLPNAVELPDLARRPADGGTLDVLFLGRLGKRKGTFDLIDAFARIAASFPTARLICAGDGEVDEAQARARSLGIADRVTCPGWISPSAAGEALRTATIFALPSYAEGLPMALLEAMSWALPVIASPVGGIPQAVRNGENGALVTPGDVNALAAALSSLLSSETQRAELGTAARLTVEQSFSLHAAIGKLLRIYGRFGIPVRESV